VFRHYASNKSSKKLELVMENYIHRYALEAIIRKILPQKSTLSPTKIILYIKITLVVLIPLITISECWLGNWNLYYTFYYLFLFILIINYITIDECIIHTHGHYEYPEIIAERCYGSPKILYVNLSEAEENLLALYAANPAKLPYTVDLYHQYIGEGINLTEHGIKFFRRFEKDDTQIYYNKRTERAFEEKDLREVAGRWFVEDPMDLMANELYTKLKNQQN
jgi:hypothetical protein